MNIVLRKRKEVFMRLLLFKLYKRFTGTSKKFNQIKRIERYTDKELAEYTNKNLTELILYAYQNAPFYRDTLRSSGVVQCNGTVKLENFSNIPLLSKEDIRNSFELLTSRELNARSWKYKTTGGSTGQPLTVIHDLERVGWVNAIKDLRNEWSRMRFGDARVRIWGSERDLFYGKESLRVRANRWVNNTVWLNAFSLTPDKMRGFVRVINRKKPKQIKGYTTCLYEFALFIERNGIDIVSPDSIICSAGTVTDTVRKKIEHVFRSKVFNSYGSREIQAMAFECAEHIGLHVMAPIVYLEIVDQDGNPSKPGEIGEVVLTPFFNYAMPLLRYRIGDMATWADSSTCTCGCHWPLIEKVEGRVTECFYKSDGSVIPPEFFIHLVGVVQNDGWIEKFQVIQEKMDRITIKLVKASEGGGNIENDLEELRQKIKVVMSNQCRVDYQFVNDIPNTPSGKYLYTISKCKK
jgi:phenylacetate-CoA ligase